jgi:hypothetical protein
LQGSQGFCSEKWRRDGKKDMSKMKCFACHKTGHYVSQCPNKKEAQVAASTSIEIDEFAEKFFSGRPSFEQQCCRVGGHWGMVCGQWIILPYDGNEVGVPQCFGDGLRLACEL